MGRQTLKCFILSYMCAVTLKFPAFLISSIVIILYVAKITYIVEMGIKTEGT